MLKINNIVRTGSRRIEQNCILIKWRFCYNVTRDVIDYEYAERQ